MKNLNQRVGVFVDVSNLYYSARNLFNSRVNFGAVLREAAGGRQLIRAIAYVISADIEQEKDFFRALELSGFEVKQKDLQIFAGGAKKGDWDVGITVDAITMAQRLDVVILISGDGDYVPLVEYLKRNTGCKVEVIAFGKSSSKKLIEEADEFTDLDKNPRKFLIKHTPEVRTNPESNNSY
ncbi:MAG: NYN domain-containing protein [Candidatus Gottesmanbacteria bacterium]